MIKALLIRGMLAGTVAGVLAFGFAQIFGEPEIEYAIGLEEQMAQAAHAQTPLLLVSLPPACAPVPRHDVQATPVGDP